MATLWIGVPILRDDDVTNGPIYLPELTKSESKAEKEEENLLDPTISRIGGSATYFRVNNSTCTDELLHYFECPNCHSVNNVSLLAQLYAPLEYYDRVIYILMCSHCTKAQSRTSLQSAFSCSEQKSQPAQPPLANKRVDAHKKSKAESSAIANTVISNKMNSRQQEVARLLKQTTNLKSYVFVVRSQNFNKAFYEEEKQKEKLKSSNLNTSANLDNCYRETNLMFNEANDWGDDDDDWGDDVNGNIKVHKRSDESFTLGKCKDFTDSNISSRTQNNEATCKEVVKYSEVVMSVDKHEIISCDSVAHETDNNTNHGYMRNAGGSNASKALNQEQEEEQFEVCHSNIGVLLKGNKYTNGILLDTFALERDNVNESRFDRSGQEDMLERELERLGDVIDSTSYEVDEEFASEKCAREYVRTIEEIPSQCVRWCPGDSPLRSSANSLPSIPCCALCGAQRQFELQLTAPIVYYLTKHLSEKDNHYVHFSNVLVYTCSAHCNWKDQPYCSEFTIVEDEL